MLRRILAPVRSGVAESFRWTSQINRIVSPQTTLVFTGRRSDDWSSSPLGSDVCWQRAAQTAVEDAAMAGFEALLGDADELTVNEDGSFNATFDLTKDQPKSLWQRFLAWCCGN